MIGCTVPQELAIPKAQVVHETLVLDVHLLVWRSALLLDLVFVRVAAYETLVALTDDPHLASPNVIEYAMTVIVSTSSLTQSVNAL